MDTKRVYEAFMGNNGCFVGYVGFLHRQPWSWIYNARLLESIFHYDYLHLLYVVLGIFVASKSNRNGRVQPLASDLRRLDRLRNALTMFWRFNRLSKSLPTRLMEYPNEVMNIAERVVQRRRRYPKHIRLPFVHHSALFLQMMQHAIQHSRLQHHTQLRAALSRIRRRDDGIRWLSAWIPQESRFEVSCQPNTAFS